MYSSLGSVVTKRGLRGREGVRYHGPTVPDAHHDGKALSDGIWRSATRSLSWGLGGRVCSISSAFAFLRFFFLRLRRPPLRCRRSCPRIPVVVAVFFLRRRRSLPLCSAGSAVRSVHTKMVRSVPPAVTSIRPRPAFSSPPTLIHCTLSTLAPCPTSTSRDHAVTGHGHVKMDTRFVQSALASRCCSEEGGERAR